MASLRLSGFDLLFTALLRTILIHFHFVQKLYKIASTQCYRL